MPLPHGFSTIIIATEAEIEEGHLDALLADGGKIVQTPIARLLPEVSFARAPVLLLLDTAASESSQEVALEAVVGRVDEIAFLAQARDTRALDRALEFGAAAVLELPLSAEEVKKVSTQLSHRSQRRRTAGALSDGLTGLPNLGGFQERLSVEFSRAADAGQGFSLLMLSIDEFSNTNQLAGHAAGDRVIVEVADLLRGPEGLWSLSCEHVARCDGDTFSVILSNTDRRGAVVAATRLRVAVEKHTFDVPGATQHTISIGVATGPADGKNPGELVDAAGVALEAARRKGRNRVVPYSPALRKSATKPEIVLVNPELIGHLEDAIATQAFKFVYQPIVNASDRTIYAYEALCRPAHPAFPNPFVLFDSAARAGMVARVGTAARPVAIAPIADLPPGRALFLNLHPHELTSNLVTDAAESLGEYASQVVFELTESASIGDGLRTLDLLNALRALGFRVAMDDLGSGYAGLNSLAQLRPDIVKLDMELVRAAAKEDVAARLVRHILEFSLGEGMSVVAEGIETQEERDRVVDLGVPLLQGWLYGKPDSTFSELPPA